MTENSLYRKRTMVRCLVSLMRRLISSRSTLDGWCVVACSTGVCVLLPVLRHRAAYRGYGGHLFGSPQKRHGDAVVVVFGHILKLKLLEAGHIRQTINVVFVWPHCTRVHLTTQPAWIYTKSMGSYTKSNASHLGVWRDDSNLAEISQDLGSVILPIPSNGDRHLCTVPSLGVGQLLLLVYIGLVALDVNIQSEKRSGGGPRAGIGLPLGTVDKRVTTQV